MATDRLGVTIATGQVYGLAGTVRFVDGDTITVTIGQGGAEQTLRVKAGDLQKQDDLMPVNASRTFSSAPSSAVAATTSQHLTRKQEVDDGFNLVIAAFLGYLAGKQDLNGNLTALAGLSGVADRVPYFTAAATLALATFSTFGRTLTAVASAVAAADAVSTSSSNIASASTTDLSTATGTLVQITGTTTITAFGTVAAGAERVLRFAGALTLTHNATSLILPTAANITTAAGDVATFRSEGSGNWRCVTYLRADGLPVGTVSLAKGGTGATTAVGAADALHTKGSSIASASTCNIAAATGVFVHITGTTTINAFGTAAAGVVRICTFDSGLYITHNGTSLIMPGGTIGTSAGDIGIFVSEGSGNWRCVSFMHSSGYPVIGSNTGDQTGATVSLEPDGHGDWSNALAGSGVADVQALAQWINDNFTP